MKVSTTTFPRSSLRESRWPSWVVKSNSGAGPIFGKLSLSAGASLNVGASQPTTASTMSSPMPHLFRTCTPLPSYHPLSTLPLHLLLEFLEETPIRALGNDLLRTALDHSHLVEAQGVEADGVFRVVLTPASIGNLPKGLRCIVQLVYIPTAHDEAGRPLRIRGTQGSGFEDGPQHPFACNGMLAHEIPMCADHAAEVLGPRAIRGCAEHQMADLPGA